MGKASKFIAAAVVIMVFLTLVYHSKKDAYENEKAFSQKYFTGELLAIEQGRGIKIYYSTTEFFYAVPDVDFKVGDHFRKTTDSLELFRNGNLVRKIKVEKPTESYFDYFTGF
ncbi:hypothetical protein FNO01nite_21590 [Flavobacterium noncentrifugens]|uniref:Uncharacterized protein n=1 Tax=Flavobacterium noncentrifugens TaxID=1128970 RepID=A0A1G9AKI4_9FLAO|nr:hypothetical protein [Flavobacterium noncentrifugens]GEP51487.1 hypothetical protein FNO01nite_21590 [Flavobacterium noncentrifugens]SDK27817.1 hypothetical protein SAMN04487935_2943 [Flavobacterium noncentrifugens]